MKLLQNTWVLVLLALILYTATIFFTLSIGLNKMLEVEPVTSHDLMEKDPEYYHWNFHTHEMAQLIESLKRERKEAKDRLEELHSIESRIDSEKEELQRLKDDIRIQREALSQYLIEVKADELQNLKTEVAIYSNMEPDNVVAIFAEISDDEVVKILHLMKPDAIAPILELMMAQPAGNGSRAKRTTILLDKLQRLKLIDEK